MSVRCPAPAADVVVCGTKQRGGDRIGAIIGRKSQAPLDGAVPSRSVLDAIRDGELRLWYQPVVRVYDGSVASIEALVRWAHPTDPDINSQPAMTVEFPEISDGCQGRCDRALLGSG
jgi:predicted signal transduction protein with EAL and GGDEF domain